MGLVIETPDMGDRASVQRGLVATLDALNEGLDDAFEAPLALASGHEVRALLARPEAAVTVMVTLADALEPARLAWGLGLGELSTDPGPRVALLDGPCLHRAHEAALRARKASAWLEVEGVPDPNGQTLACLMKLVGAIREDWTEKRARYVLEARTRMQREVAEELGVAESTVSQALKAAHFGVVLEAESAATALLEWLGSTDLEEVTP